MSIQEKGESLIRLLVAEGVGLAQEIQKGVKRKADNTLMGVVLVSFSSSLIVCGGAFSILSPTSPVILIQPFELPIHYLLITFGVLLLFYSVRLIYFTKVVNINKSELLLNFSLKVAHLLLEEKPTNNKEGIQILLRKIEELEESIDSLDSNDEPEDTGIRHSISC